MRASVREVLDGQQNLKKVYTYQIHQIIATINVKKATLYDNVSFVHYFKAISELKLELQSGNAQFGSKSTFFCPVRPWNLTDDLKKQ